MTLKYHINIFWSEADDAWVADVPDSQSCSAFGDTPADALAEVEKAMEAWLAIARRMVCRPRSRDMGSRNKLRGSARRAEIMR